MSKLLGFGMTISEAIARATANPSRIVPLFNDRGTFPSAIVLAGKRIPRA